MPALRHDPFGPRFRPIHLLPNLVTTGSLFCGLMAMYHIVVSNDATIKACWYIIIAAILDALDGLIARLTGTESEFGVQFDSLADAIVFGVTPALLMFLHVRAEAADPFSAFVKVAQFACMIFTICGVARLARFNAMKGATGRKTFTGMPIPAAAAMVVSTYLLARAIDSVWVLRAMPAIMMLLALLMVSTFEYHSIKSIDLESPRPFESLIAAIMLMGLVFVFKSHIEMIIFGVMSLYALSGPALSLVRRLRGDGTSARDDESEHAEAVAESPDPSDAPPVEGARVHEVPRRAAHGK